MIELKIDGDLAKYIDTEELQRNAEYEVQYQIKNAVTQMIREDESVQKIIKGVIEKVIAETEFSVEVKSLVQDRVFKTVENMSDWDVKYASNVSDAFKEVASTRENDIKDVINKKIDEVLSTYEVGKYEIQCGVNEIITEKIMEEAANIDLKEKLNMFVRNGLDRVMEQLSY